MENKNHIFFTIGKYKSYIVRNLCTFYIIITVFLYHNTVTLPPLTVFMYQLTESLYQQTECLYLFFVTKSFPMYYGRLYI